MTNTVFKIIIRQGESGQIDRHTIKGLPYEVILLPNLSLFGIRSSDIRRSGRLGLLPQAVKDYITRNRLYNIIFADDNEDGSSTDTRDNHSASPIKYPHSVEELKQLIERGNLQELIRVSEAKDKKDIVRLARKVARLPKENVVLLTGPSGSGKTTLTQRINKNIKKWDRGLLSLPIDNYYKNLADIHKTNNGIIDFDSPEALDLDLVNRHMRVLLAGGTVNIPTYDMGKDTRLTQTISLRLEENQILVIEGLLALHPTVLEGIEPGRRFSIFVNVSPTLQLSSGTILTSSDLRLIRRIVRDKYFRGKRVVDIIKKWPLVLQNEARYIWPKIEEADLVVDTYLPYELSIFKYHVMAMLENAEINVAAGEDQNALQEIERLKYLLNDVPEVSIVEIPEDSILREFVGDKSDANTSSPIKAVDLAIFKVEKGSSPLSNKFNLFTFKNIIAKTGWVLAGAGAVLSLWGIFKYPAIGIEFSSVLAQGWLLIGLLYISNLFRDSYSKQILIITAGLSLIFFGFYDASSLENILEVLSSMLIRFVSAFLGVNLGLILFNNAWRKSLVKSFRDKDIDANIFKQFVSSLRWAVALGIISGFFVYFSLF